MKASEQVEGEVTSHELKYQLRELRHIQADLKQSAKDHFVSDALDRALKLVNKAINELTEEIRLVEDEEVRLSVEEEA